MPKPYSIPNSAAFNRRAFLRRAGAATACSAAALGSGTFLAAVSRAGAQTRGPGLDAAVLNFALNLEYLEAEYYTFATTGNSIEALGVGVDGSGTPGGVTIKGDPAVPFSTPAFQQYALEIAADERAHVLFVRAALMAGGVQPVARPAIDLLESFSTLAQVAGIVGPGETFDPFANEINFLLGAFIFEDVGVTAFKGASPLLANKDVLEATAGILAVEAYHAGVIRTVLNAIGQQPEMSEVLTIVQKISDLRDALDGEDDRDQGLVDESGNSNLVPTDENAIAFSRTTRQVLNIVYGGVDAPSGLFFPNGLNGEITA